MNSFSLNRKRLKRFEVWKFSEKLEQSEVDEKNDFTDHDQVWENFNLCFKSS